MRLALKAGRLDWRRAINEISISDFMDWLAFSEIEPYGGEWHQASMVASVAANELRMIAAGFGGEKLKPEDMYSTDAFVPGVGERKAAEEKKKITESLDDLIGL